MQQIEFACEIPENVTNSRVLIVVILCHAKCLLFESHIQWCSLVRDLNEPPKFLKSENVI